MARDGSQRQMRGTDQIASVQILQTRRAPVGPVQDQRLGPVDEAQLGLHARCPKLRDVAQHRPGRKIDPILAGFEILDHVGAAIGAEDEDVGPGPTAQPVRARPVNQNVVSRPGREAALAGGDQQVGAGAASGARSGLGDPLRPEIGTQPGETSLRGAGHEDVDPVARAARREGRDVGQTRCWPVGQMRQTQQAPVGQKQVQADPVIGPARDHVAPAPVADRLERGDARKAAVAIVEQVVRDRQGAVLAGPDHADRAAARRPEHEIVSAISLDRRQGRSLRDPQAVLGREAAAIGEAAIAVDREHAQTRHPRARGKEVVGAAEPRMGQRRDRIGQYGRGGQGRDPRQPAIGVEQHRADPAPVGETAIDRDAPVGEAQRLGIGQTAGQPGAAQRPGRAEFVLRAPQREGGAVSARQQGRAARGLDHRDLRRGTGPVGARKLDRVFERETIAPDRPAFEPPVGARGRKEPGVAARDTGKREIGDPRKIRLSGGLRHQPQSCHRPCPALICGDQG